MVEIQASAIGSDPEAMLSVLVDGIDVVITQAVGVIDIMPHSQECSCVAVHEIESHGGTDPKVSQMIFADGSHLIIA